MTLEEAIDVIEGCSGFTDASTPVGEAWGVVLWHLGGGRPNDREIVDMLRELASTVHASAEELASMGFSAEAADQHQQAAKARAMVNSLEAGK